MTGRTRRALIEYKVAKPFVDAVALGAGSAAFATVLQGPALNWSLVGGGFSLVWYWGSANLAKPKKGKARGGGIGPAIVVNSINGSRKVRRDGKTFNYQPYQPHFVSRETIPEILRRLVRGKPRVRQSSSLIVLREFVFRSHYEGQLVELAEDDVRRFLRSAWRNRQRGSGLSQRRWVRDCRLRPQWYKDLGPYWYYALLALIGDAQQRTHRQLIVGNSKAQHYRLACDPHTTLGRLKEAEAIKRGTTPPADVLSINFDRGESSF